MSQARSVVPSRLPDPPEEYDPVYMRDLVRRLEAALAKGSGIQSPLLIDEARSVVWRAVGTTTAGALITDTDT